MSGTDLDPHALAANIRSLSHDIQEMRAENHEWRERLLCLLQGVAHNEERNKNQEERLEKLEDEVSYISAWRWKTIGTASGVSATIGALFMYLSKYL